MPGVTRRAFVRLSIGTAILAAACGSGPGAGSPSPVPSGALGPVTQGAADEAIRGLCEVAVAPDRNSADAAFADRSHQTLHVIAAATEVVDRAAAAGLLRAKQLVEADLAEPELPGGFAADVESLIEAAREALAKIGLDAPACAD
jgi:hypothetical protein